MTFIVLYQREAHANEMMFSEIDQPEKYEERLALANKYCEELNVATTVVLDEMDNQVREAYGLLPNSIYFVDKGGKIYYKEAWARNVEWVPMIEAMLAGKEPPK